MVQIGAFLCLKENKMLRLFINVVGFLEFIAFIKRVYRDEEAQKNEPKEDENSEQEQK